MVLSVISLYPIYSNRSRSRSRSKCRKTHLPELLRGILPSNPLQNLRATRMLVDEIRHVVDVAVDDDIEAVVGCVVRRHVLGSELRHFRVLLVSSVSVLCFWVLNVSI